MKGRATSDILNTEFVWFYHCSKF